MIARRLPPASLTLALLAACGGKPAPRSAEPARAYVSDGTGLVEVSVPGGARVVGPAAAWCSVDARADVVWFTDARGLHALDLTDRRTRTIIAGDLGQLAVIIDWGTDQLGGESKLAFDVGVAVKLAAAPALAVVMGCEGDRAVYCFEEDLATPTADVAAQKQRAGAVRLADTAYLAKLAARGAGRALWSPPPVPPDAPAQKPSADPAECTEEPARCGELTAIPASPLWLVHTANSRGDYYHETRELWDPATGEYLRRDGAELLRSKAPPHDGRGGDLGGLRVSTGGLLTIDGAVFDGAKVHYAPREEAGVLPSSCGFTGGGWRIPGPQDG